MSIYSIDGKPTWLLKVSEDYQWFYRDVPTFLPFPQVEHKSSGLDCGWSTSIAK